MSGSGQRPRARKLTELIPEEKFIVGYQQRIICHICLATGLSLLIILAVILGVVGKMENHLPLIAGLILLATGVALSFAISNHTPLQRQVISALVCLGGSAVATDAITGALNVQLTLGEKTGITASGALAVFIVLYFYRSGWDRE